MLKNEEHFDSLYINNKLLKKIKKEINVSFFNINVIYNNVDLLIKNFLCKFHKYLILDIKIFSHDAVFNEENYSKGVDIQNYIMKYDYKKLQFKNFLLYNILE